MLGLVLQSFINVLGVSQARAGQLPFRVGKTIADGAEAAGPGQGSGYYSSSSAADERHPLSVTAHNGPFAIWLISAAAASDSTFPFFPLSSFPCPSLPLFSLSARYHRHHLL